jgi:short-subunit dehydrogenase
MNANETTTGAQVAPARGPRRRALVTGASTGIGEAFADRLARDQYDLILVARSAERLEALAKRLETRSGIQAEVAAADLVVPEERARIEDRLAGWAPDLLVNNAGFGTIGRFADLDLSREVREIELNVVALVRLSRAVLPRMVERGHGAIINVSSLAGEAATPYNATYGATKAFVTSFSEALSEELRDSGVRVQALLPGFTRTEFQERAGMSTGHLPEFAWMSPEAVVDASLAALERGATLCIPGASNRLLSSVQRLVPRGLRRRAIAALTRSGLP